MLGWDPNRVAVVEGNESSSAGLSPATASRGFVVTSTSCHSPTTQ